jgi:hypothetical protein
LPHAISILIKKIPIENLAHLPWFEKKEPWISLYFLNVGICGPQNANIFCMRKQEASGNSALSPWPAKNSMFSDFFWKNSIFFRQIVSFCPPLEKSLRTPINK